MATQVQTDFRRVIVAASVGNVIEWYDFAAPRRSCCTCSARPPRRVRSRSLICA